MKIIVQKFGGTSLASPSLRKQVSEKVIKAKAQGFKPVVVVSAMGRNGDPYATDTLISAAKEVHPEIPARELDLLMSCGEIISGVFLVNTLHKFGHKAVILTGSQARIITDDNYNDARIQRIDPKVILDYLSKDFIVVVTGFQGVTEDGNITTLGRGGSDTTAAALGVALQAEVVDIYTDVEGVMTADPRIVNDAKILDVVTYNEICQLAQQGAKVIHPRAVEIAMQKNIPLRVRCTFSEGEGTLVTSYGEVLELGITKGRPITGITNIDGVTQIKIISGAHPDIVETEMKVFKAMALGNISVDFINVYPEAVVYTVRDEVGEKARQILENMGFQPEVIPNCAKVSAVGAGMTGIPGVMASIVEALTKEGVKILQSADSYTTIWCLVRGEDMEKSVKALHKQFNLNI